jgi:hypothetical protein
LLLFLLPGGRPRRFNADIQAGGLPRRFPRPLAKRSNVTIASSTCSRSCRKSASILSTSIFVSLAFLLEGRQPAGSEKRTKSTLGEPH